MLHNWGTTRILRGLGLAAILCLFVGSGILLWWQWRPRTVKDIQVTGNRGLSVPEVIRLSGLQSGKKYDSAELSKAEEILSLHPFIEEVQIKRERLSSGERLQIRIKERSCVALVQNSKEPDIIYEVDEKLNILSENHIRCREVPLLRGQFQKTTEKFSDPVLRKMVRAVLRIRELYPDLAPRISEMQIRHEGGFQIFLSGRTIRIDIPARLESQTIRQLYGTIAWLEKNRIKKGVVYLRGNESLVLPSRNFRRRQSP